MARLTLRGLEEARRLLGLPRSVEESALRKLYLYTHGGRVVFTPRERELLIAAMFLDNPFGYRVDLSRPAGPGNPWLGRGDIPGVDTPDARPLALRVMRRVEEALRRRLLATLRGTAVRHPVSVRTPRPSATAVQTGAPEKPPRGRTARRTRQPRAARRTSTPPAARRRAATSGEAQRLASYLWSELPPKLRSKWRYIQVLALAKLITRLAREKGVDPLSIDWLHEIDWAAGYQAAKQRVLSILQPPMQPPTEKDLEEMERYYMEQLEQSHYEPAWMNEEPQPWELAAMEQSIAPA